MIVFELLVNGESVARAGANDLSVLSHTLTACGVLGEESLGTTTVKSGHVLELALTGLTSRHSDLQNVHRQWYSSRELHVGDEVTVRILEVDAKDIPKALLRGES